MTARKSRRTAKKKTVRKKVKAKTALQRLEDELPVDLKAYSKRVKRGLNRLEREIEHAQRDVQRRWTRLLREVSHQLGSIEARGEREWRRRTTRARRDAVKLLKRLEQAIEPARPKSQKKVVRKKAARRKVARKQAVTVTPTPAPVIEAVAPPV